MSRFVLLLRHVALHHLHPFPTRRSSDLANDLAGALFLAHDRSKPFLIAPAMNPAMWSHPATVASVEKLTQWGVRFLDRKSTRLNSSHVEISYAVFCLEKKNHNAAS